MQPVMRDPVLDNASISAWFALLIRWSLVRIKHGSLKESPVFEGLSAFPAAELSMSAEAILAQMYTDYTRAVLVTP